MPEKVKLIITADDYGFCDEVDQGIRDASFMGLINSVAVLPNGYDGQTRLQLLRDIQAAYERGSLRNTDSRVDHLDIGCHFTITSGQAITEAARNNPYLSENGYFRKFNNMRRPEMNNEEANEELLGVLYDELMAQLAVFKDIVKVAHLSSHHDSLVFFRDYYDVFLKIARKEQIPVRSPAMIPQKRQKTYYGLNEIRLQADLSIDWQDAYEEFRLARLNGHEPDLVNGIKAPDYLFGGNYFSRALPLGIWEEGPQNRAANKKMRENYPEYKPGNLVKQSDEEPLSLRGFSVEICAHLIDPNNSIDFNNGGPNYRKKDHPHYYPGVDSAYFDGRAMEFRLLQKLKPRIFQDDNVEFVRWDTLSKQ